MDTAGIHDSQDKVESIGIERSKEAFNRADLLLLVTDASRPLSEEDKELLKMAEGRAVIIISNKTDLCEERGAEADQTFAEANSALAKASGTGDIVYMSAINGEGLTELEDRIEQFVTGGKVRREDDVIVTNIRHARLLSRAAGELGEAVNMIKRGEAMDFIEVNIRSAYDLLGEITGDTAGDDVLSEVFSRFCLGK